MRRIQNSSKTILQISSQWIPTSPIMRYGGTERVVLYLDKVYHKMGHNSIVAAPADSRPYGTLLETRESSVWTSADDGVRNITRGAEYLKEPHQRIIEYILKSNGNHRHIDIVHDHADDSILISEAYRIRGHNIRVPILTTLHGPVSEIRGAVYEELVCLQREGEGNIHFVAISNSQRRAYSDIGIDVNKVIYHGLPLDEIPYFESWDEKAALKVTSRVVDPKLGYYLWV